MDINKEEEIYNYHKSHTFPEAFTAEHFGISVSSLRKIIARYEKKNEKKDRAKERFNEYMEYLARIESPKLERLNDPEFYEAYKQGFVRGFMTYEVDLLSKKKKR